ncbi:MAG: hypothetical protein IT332_05020 [Ardenticatenales bacterium]|nr:hypothetical protein [Ardenticatenales bacterium]
MVVQFVGTSAEHADLTPGQAYVVIGIEADDYRLLNDEGRPYLYPAAAFTVADPREPTDWISELGDDGERYAYPAPLNAPGFFEDYFDTQAAAVTTFWRTINQRLASATAA